MQSSSHYKERWISVENGLVKNLIFDGLREGGRGMELGR